MDSQDDPFRPRDTLPAVFRVGDVATTEDNTVPSGDPLDDSEEPTARCRRARA